MIITMSALTKSLSEYVSCRPRWRLVGGGGVGICSTSQSKLTRILPGVSISVPPKYEVWSLQYFRGSRAQVNPSARLYIDFRSFRFMTTSDLDGPYRPPSANQPFLRHMRSAMVCTCLRFLAHIRMQPPRNRPTE